MTYPSLIYIHWQDANYNVEQTPHEHLGMLLDLYEFGWLVRETEEAYVVCSEWAEDAESSRLTLTVPKINVVQAKKFKFENVLRGGRKCQ